MNAGGEFTSPSFVPLFLVFLSGIGFSIQTLFIKLLSTDDGFSGSFQIIFLRGLTQAVLSLLFIYRDFRQQCERNGESKQALFGSTSTVRSLLALRSLFGYGGIAFAFLSVEKLPIGDATVLVMLSPLFASLCSWAVLREPFRLGEMVAAAIALAGVVLVARPPFIFGGQAENDAAPAPADGAGVVYALLASVCAGIAYTCVRMLGTTAKTPWANVCLAQALGQILLSPPSLVLSGQRLRVDLPLSIFGIMFIAGFIGAWSQIAMTVGMQREKSALATGMRMSDVVAGFTWQAIFTNEKVTGLSIAGAFLVVISTLILVLAKAYYPQTPPREEDGVQVKEEGKGGAGSGLHFSPLHMDSTHSGASVDDSLHSSGNKSVSRGGSKGFSILGDGDEEEEEEEEERKDFELTAVCVSEVDDE